MSMAVYRRTMIMAALAGITFNPTFAKGESLMPLAGRRVVQLALPTRDLNRARAFYEGVLGLPLMFETNGMLFFRLGDIRLMIGSNAEGALEPVDGSTIYFDAPDLPVLAESLERRGVRFLGPAEVVMRTATDETQLRFFRDPDQNLLALMGTVPLSGA